MSRAQPPFQVQLVLWGALLFSQFMLLGVLQVVPPPGPTPEPMLRWVVSAMALGTAAAAFVVPPMILKTNLARLQIPTVDVEDPDALPGFGKKQRVARDPAQALRAIGAPLQVKLILACALSEAVSLQGFVLKFLGFDWLAAGPLFALGIGLCALQMPNQARNVKEAEALLGLRLTGS